MATKPTKQQVAQAKARAGGNNPIKVTNSGLKKLGSAALLAASFTPAGRVVKSVATVAKAAKAEGIMAKAGWNAAAKTNYRAQVKREAAAKTSQIAKNSVKVKPAAKTKPKPPNKNQIEHRFGMGNNRMINRGVPVEARAAGGKSRRDAIAESKLTGKPVKNTKPKLVIEKSPVKPRVGMRGGGLGGLNKANR